MQEREQIRKQYAQREQDFADRATTSRQRYERLSWVRLGSFIGLVAVVIWVWSWLWWVGLVTLLLSIGVFARFIRWHETHLAQARFYETLQQINADEQAALAGDTSAFLAGERFVDTQHPYTYDLDVFGPHSLYQFFNRTTTEVGETMLATWLCEPATAPVIEQRQGAVQELNEKLDWRQELQAKGQLNKRDEKGVDRLLHWLHQPPVVLGHGLRRIARWAVPLLVLTGLVLWFLYLPWFVAILFLVPGGWILSRALDEVNALHNLTNRATATLRTYADLIEHIEQTDMAHPHLVRLQAVFKHGATPASHAIRQLGYALSQLDVRYNAFAILLEITVVWDLQWAYRLDKWKEEHRQQLPAWFDALAELEALSSLATIQYNNPDWTCPTIAAQAELSAEGLGHPLLLATVRVPNDIAMPTRGHIHLVTGSNMAGKSTWLRTVGLNIVLALAGAPVCARSLRVPPLQVYTSMRTQDALHESTSSFFAELKRLKFIIEAVENTDLTGGRPVFFLLDEILKGTNSRDRHTGAKALIRQLIQKRGAGIIATHDLELGALEEEASGTIENWRIEVAIDDGELHFDYKLKRGVSESFNATLLMRQMGIDV